MSVKTAASFTSATNLRNCETLFYAKSRNTRLVVLVALDRLITFQPMLLQINGIQALAKCTGWQVLSSSTHHLGCGSVEPLGNATGCLLSNPAGDRLIAVRHSPQSGTASVFVATSPKKDFFTTSIIKDGRWSNLPDSFHEVNVEKMDGRNLLNKIELLMAALTTLNGTAASNM